jgi:tripartite ATP-independent transporter DctP family solute receptor
MKMRGVLKSLGFLATLFLTMAGFFGISHGANPEVTFRSASDLPIGNHLTRAQEFYAQRVGEISKGRVLVEVYPAGQLFAAKDYPKAVPSGAVDMAQCWAAQWTGLVPSISVLDLYFFYDDWPHFWRTIDSGAGEILSKDMEKAGVKTLYWIQDGTDAFATKGPLKKLDDFKGKRIRVGTELGSHAVKNLGGAPAFMGGGEVYMALQRGTVDGATSSVTSFRDRKYFEVTKYVTDPGCFYAPYMGVMNLKKWNGLPADIKKILLEAGKDTQAWGRKEVLKESAEALGDLKKNGMEIYYLPKEERELWKKACKPLENIIITKTGDLGRQLLALAEKVR